MNGAYLGHLAQNDPMWGYLKDHIFPQLEPASETVGCRVFQPPDSRNVYIYEEINSGLKVLAKFHTDRLHHTDNRDRSGETEYQNLLFLRSIGFDVAPNYVVKPLGFNRELDGVIVMEFLEGSVLSHVITDAIYLGRRDRLFRKLSNLARFLATMHNRTAGEWTVNFEQGYSYMGQLINSLIVRRDMGQDHSVELYELREAWFHRACMWEDRSVLVHGDVTPSNFLIGRGPDIMAIDLERMKWDDRAFDPGRLCGEIKHFFLQRTGKGQPAEPFIGHFLWEYSGHFPDRTRAFQAITRRIPFYMGTTLLRIARNSWINHDYRWRLVREAKQILRGLP